MRAHLLKRHSAEQVRAKVRCEAGVQVRVRLKVAHKYKHQSQPRHEGGRGCGGCGGGPLLGHLLQVCRPLTPAGELERQELHPLFRSLVPPHEFERDLGGLQHGLVTTEWHPPPCRAPLGLVVRPPLRCTTRGGCGTGLAPAVTPPMVRCER